MRGEGEVENGEEVEEKGEGGAGGCRGVQVSAKCKVHEGSNFQHVRYVTDLSLSQSQGERK